jgi:hypothetical protein
VKEVPWKCLGGQNHLLTSGKITGERFYYWADHRAGLCS